MSGSFVIHARAAALPDRRWLTPAWILVRDGKIEKLSDTPLSGDQIIDLPDTTLLPGFINAHCHLELTALNPLPEKNFTLWIQNIMTAAQSLENVAKLAGIKSGIAKLIASGVTTIFDHVSAHTDLTEHARAPIDIFAFGEVLGSAQKNAAPSLANLRAVKKTATIPYHITPHSVHAVASPILAQVLREEAPPFSIHLAESADEKTYFSEKSGPLFDLIQSKNGDVYPDASAIAAIQRLGGLRNSLLVHGNHLSENDFTQMTDWPNCCVVHCPGSYEYFAHTGFDPDRLRSRKIPIALGTDSLASNSDLNFLHEIKLYLKAHPQNDFWEFLPLLGANAAHAIGLTGHGNIAVGQTASFTGFNNAAPNALLKTLPERTQADFVMANGKVLVTV
jgi:cytosine/adenosine deaminase-related metal-dependent hydrolase